MERESSFSELLYPKMGTKGCQWYPTLIDENLSRARPFLSVGCGSYVLKSPNSNIPHNNTQLQHRDASSSIKVRTCRRCYWNMLDAHVLSVETRLALKVALKEKRRCWVRREPAFCIVERVWSIALMLPASQHLDARLAPQCYALEFSRFDFKISWLIPPSCSISKIDK